MLCLLQQHLPVTPVVICRTSNIDAKIENFPTLKTKFRRNACSVCKTPGPVLFCIPSDED
ncbi:hypothetical protein AVEN_5034-1, partial [Araneus ventricosus]